MSDMQLYLVEKLWEYQKDSDDIEWTDARNFVQWMFGVDDETMNCMIIEFRDSFRKENEKKLEKAWNAMIEAYKEGENGN